MWDKHFQIDYCAADPTNVACQRGGCLGERIYIPGVWNPTERQCIENGGKCCALNINGQEPWTTPNSNTYGDCWYCFTEWGSGQDGYVNTLPAPNRG